MNNQQFKIYFSKDCSKVKWRYSCEIVYGALDAIFDNAIYDRYYSL